MNRKAKIILVILLIGGMFMLSRYGGFSNLKYEKYSSKDPQLNITMDYVSGWRYSEHRGAYDSYAQVQFYETADKDIAASMVVTVMLSSKVEFTPLTIEAMTQHLLVKTLKLKDAKVLSKSKSKFLNTEAINIALAYKTLDKLRSVNAKFIPMRERIVIFKQGDKFYTIRYINREEAFAKFDRAFSHCLKTVRLKAE